MKAWKRSRFLRARHLTARKDAAQETTMFFERLDAEVSRSSRHGNPLSLLMVDVDHFKSSNDRDGHQRGDLVLAALVCCVL